MMHIESNKQSIARPASEIYVFIKDFRNFERLMPPQVMNYQAGYEQCSFEISSMGRVSLEMKERIEDQMIRAASTAGTAINFDLIVNLVPESTGSSLVRAELNAELSPMLAMLARNPLNNFINMLVDKLKEVMEPV
jgi:carbon monoxide dehydrogenase subunit G